MEGEAEGRWRKGRGQVKNSWEDGEVKRKREREREGGRIKEKEDEEKT